MMQREDRSGVPGRRAAGYCPPQPEESDFVRWPVAFGTRFTVFVDTEEEFDWHRPFRRDMRATTAIEGMPDTHRRFAARGVPLTFLVDHPIATSPRAVEVLRALIEDGQSTIGAQLHPWVTPPNEEKICGINSFSGNLSESLERAKLTQLTDTIIAVFGFRPLVYRAGRYGIGPHSMAALHALGYRADSSMRAGYDYRALGGPDFRAVGVDAFRTGPGGAVLELPLTTLFLGRARARGARLYSALGRFPGGRGLAARLGLLSRVALTPEDMPIAEAEEAVRVAVGEGVRLLNFSFHSPSVVPGHTPYVRDAADLAAFHGWWERMFDLLERLGVAPVSLAGILDAASKPA